MFLGHFAVGFAAKRAAPRVPVTVLLIAAMFLDVLWPVFLWLGIETVRIDPGNTAFTPLDFVRYPWSHSLVMALAWSALFAALYRAITRDRAGAAWVAICVLSHWVLDGLTHRADLPLFPWGGPKVGLGLWNSVAATAGTEIAMAIAGLLLYLSATRARNWAGRLSLGSLVAVLAFFYVGTVRGDVPPSVDAIKVMMTLLILVMLAWFSWIDRTREPRTSRP